MATLTVTGPDALSWLNGLVTQELVTTQDDLRLLQPSFFLTKQGKIRASLVVLREPERVTLGVVNPEGLVAPTESKSVAGDSGAAVEALRRELDHYLVMEDAEIEIDAKARWFVQMPTNEHDPADSVLLGSEASVHGFQMLGAETAWIIARGEPLLSRELPSLGAAWDELRLEWGLPWFGTDYGSSDNPHEAGLERAYVSFSKGCYLGQEVVCMQEMRGKVKRRIVRLSAEAASLELTAGTPVTTETGDVIGKTTTAHGSRALAMLKAPYDAAGSVVWALGARCSVSALEPGTAWAV